jgi:two-component system chemotaxis sensor kinase CheA
VNSNDRHIQAFWEEARELMVELEQALLELEENPGDTETVDRISRFAHTIKGSASMFGLDDVSGLLHEFERVFDLVRKGEISVTKEIVDFSLSARDEAHSMIMAIKGGGTPDTEVVNEIIELFRSLVPDAENRDTLLSPREDRGFIA